jgi:hypothetical protein
MTAQQRAAYQQVLNKPMEEQVKRNKEVSAIKLSFPAGLWAKPDWMRSADAARHSLRHNN